MSLPITMSITIDQVIHQFVSFAENFFKRQLATLPLLSQLMKYFKRKILKGV